MDELEVEYLKGQIRLVNMDIEAAKSRIRGLEEVLEGQHFMLGGKEYVGIEVDSWGCVNGRHITKSGTVSLRRTYISSSDYSRIQPLPMEK